MLNSVNAWLNPTEDGPHLHAWLGPGIPLLERVRGAGGRLHDLSGDETAAWEKLGRLVDENPADSLYPAGVGRIVGDDLLPGLPNSAGAAMAALVAGVRAAEAWQSGGKERAFPHLLDSVEGLAAAGYGVSGFSNVPEEVNPWSEDHRDGQAFDDAVVGLWRKYPGGADASCWLSARRLVRYLLGLEGPEPTFGNRLAVLAGYDSGEGRVLHVRTALEGAPAFAPYLDTVSFGLTAPGGQLVESLRTAWRVCTVPGETRPLTGEGRPLAVQIALEATGETHLDGPSAGLLLACGLRATLRRDHLDETVSATAEVVPPKTGLPSENLREHDSDIPNRDFGGEAAADVRLHELGDVGAVTEKLRAAEDAGIDTVVLAEGQHHRYAGDGVAVRHADTLGQAYGLLVSHSGGWGRAAAAYAALADDRAEAHGFDLFSTLGGMTLETVRVDVRIARSRPATSGSAIDRRPDDAHDAGLDEDVLAETRADVRDWDDVRDDLRIGEVLGRAGFGKSTLLLGEAKRDAAELLSGVTAGRRRDGVRIPAFVHLPLLAERLHAANAGNDLGAFADAIAAVACGAGAVGDLPGGHPLAPVRDELAARIADPARAGTVRLLLDAYDEVIHRGHRAALNKSLGEWKRRCGAGGEALMTSRPASRPSRGDGTGLRIRPNLARRDDLAEAALVIRPFGKRQVKAYVRNVFNAVLDVGPGKADRRADDYAARLLSAAPRLRQAASVPLMLYFLCRIGLDRLKGGAGATADLPTTRAKIFGAVVDGLIDGLWRMHGGRETLTGDERDDWRALAARLAYKTFDEGVLFTRQRAADVLEAGPRPEGYNGSGAGRRFVDALVHRRSLLAAVEPGGDRLRFLLRPLHEHLAARHLASVIGSRGWDAAAGVCKEITLRRDWREVCVQLPALLGPGPGQGRYFDLLEAGDPRDPFGWRLSVSLEAGAETDGLSEERRGRLVERVMGHLWRVSVDGADPRSRLLGHVRQAAARACHDEAVREYLTGRDGKTGTCDDSRAVSNAAENALKGKVFFNAQESVFGRPVRRRRVGGLHDLGHGDEEVRIAAVKAFANAVGRADVRHVYLGDAGRAGARDSSPRVRTLALRALAAEAGREEVLDVLLGQRGETGLRDRHVAVRHEAARGLTGLIPDEIAGPRALPAFDSE